MDILPNKSAQDNPEEEGLVSLSTCISKPRVSRSETLDLREQVVSALQLDDSLQEQRGMIRTMDSSDAKVKEKKGVEPNSQSSGVQPMSTKYQDQSPAKLGTLVERTVPVEGDPIQYNSDKIPRKLGNLVEKNAPVQEKEKEAEKGGVVPNKEEDLLLETEDNIPLSFAASTITSSNNHHYRTNVRNADTRNSTASTNRTPASPGAIAVNPQGTQRLYEGQLTLAPHEQGESLRQSINANTTTGTNTVREDDERSGMDSLAEAVPVEEDNPMGVADPVVHMEEGKRQSLQQDNQRKKKAIVGLGLLALIVLIIAIVLAVVLTRESSPPENALATNAPSTDIPVPTDDSMLIQTMQDLGLPNTTINTILSSPNSPQAQAFQWVSTQDNLSKNAPNWKKLQRFVLANFYFATNGPQWTSKQGWLDPNLDECNDWFHRTVISKGAQMGNSQLFDHPSELNQTESIQSPCNEQGRFQVLAFSDNALSGTIPPEVALLTHLTYLDVSAAEEGMTGSLPTELGLLTKLQRLFANRNQLTGSLPTELGLLSSLEMIDLGNNQNFTGPIPTELGLLSNSLQILSLQRTSLTGYVPTELYRLTNLQEYLIHQSLRLTGGTLEGMGALSNVREFVAHDIPYSSTIPTEIGLLTNLINFNLWNTMITGQIPSELWSLSTLVRMDIDDNFLSGTFPNQLLQLTSLQVLWINGNLFTSTLPTFGWNNMKNLTFLNIGSNSGGNQLTGTLPSELGVLTGLTQLGLHRMNMTGTIPSEFGQLTNMATLLLHNTSIAGTIPSEMLGLTNLEAFTVSNTLLTGSIPENLCPSLKEVYLNCEGNVGGFGVVGDVCDVYKTSNFSCVGSLLCGCSCEPCGN